MLYYLFLLLLSPYVAWQDAPEAWQMGFQDPATPVMQGIIDLHDDICFFLIVILSLVLWMLIRTLYFFHESKNPIPEKIIHGTSIEIAWTVAPSLILVLIAVPSFALLYSMDEMVDPAITVIFFLIIIISLIAIPYYVYCFDEPNKPNPTITIDATGHQYYWSYQYRLQDCDNFTEFDSFTEFDRYPIPTKAWIPSQVVCCEVDNRVVVPINFRLTFRVTSSDVVHSWTVPGIDIYCPAVPGLLNQATTTITQEGLYYGGCYPCSVDPFFSAPMPIVVEAVSVNKFIAWVRNQKQKPSKPGPKPGQSPQSKLNYNRDKVSPGRGSDSIIIKR